jgi:hypothetical protein
MRWYLSTRRRAGKLKIVNTLTKAGGFTKKAGESAIILKSDDYIVHPRVDHGKTMTQQEMRRSGYTDKIAEKANKQKAKKDEYKLDIKIENGQLFSEDYIMSHKLRSLGFDLWVDPRMGCIHYGPKGFGGHFIKWLEDSGRFQN